MASLEVAVKLCLSQANASDSSDVQSRNGLTDMMKAATIVGKSEAANVKADLILFFSANINCESVTNRSFYF